MVSRSETIPSRLFMTSSEPTKEGILERLVALEEENEKLRKENKRLRAKLRWHEGPHTSLSKDQSDQEESSSSSPDEDDEQPRTDGGTLGRKPGHDPEWRSAPDPAREIESPVAAVQSPVKRSTNRRASAPDSSRNFRIHSHPKSVQPPPPRVSFLWDRDCRLTPRLPR